MAFFARHAWASSSELSTTVFLKALEKSIALASSFRYYFLLLPAAFFASSLIVNYLAPEAKGHGTEKVIEAVHKRWGKIDPWVVPVKLVATIVTIAFGRLRRQGRSLCPDRGRARVHVCRLAQVR